MKKFLIKLENNDVLYVEYETKFIDGKGIRYYVDCDGDTIAYDPSVKEVFVPGLNVVRMKVKCIMNPVKKNVRKTH